MLSLRYSCATEKMNPILMHGRVCLLLAIALLSSCGLGDKTSRIEREADIPPSIPGAVPPRMKGADSAASGGGSPVLPSGPVELTPEEEIIFTDPDNPDANIPELSTLLESTPKRRKGPWEDSEAIARKRSLREGKPLLIWFTDSRSSPMCKALAQELFNNPAFNEWADQHFIRLRVDSQPQVTDQSLSLDEKETKLVEIRAYVKRIKKQYKILGHPNLILVHPDGSVIGRYRGYKRGDAEFTWGLLKQGEAAFQHTYKDWKGSLEKRGYRQWTDTKGRTVFAKLVSYSKGTLMLIEPDGTRSKTHENRLSNEDRMWIDEQKAARGL
jgi:thioredoxin-related protein